MDMQPEVAVFACASVFVSAVMCWTVIAIVCRPSSAVRIRVRCHGVTVIDVAAPTVELATVALEHGLALAQMPSSNRADPPHGPRA